MQLHSLIEQIPDFESDSPREKIKVLAWWLHAHGGKELFSAPEIRECFRRLHVDEPPAIATYLMRMAEGKELLKEKGQYKLARAKRGGNQQGRIRDLIVNRQEPLRLSRASCS